MSGRYPSHDLDAHTADRLLSLDETAVTPELAPLAGVLWAAAAIADLDDRAGEEQALAAFRAAMAAERSVASWRPHQHRRSAPARAAALVVGLSVLFGGAIGAAAATGYLPEPAQRAARELFERVGIHLPEPAHASDKQPVEPVSTDPDAATPDPSAPPPGELPDAPTTDDVDAGSGDETADTAASQDALADGQAAPGDAGQGTQTPEEEPSAPSTTDEALESPAPTTSATPPASSKPATPPSHKPSDPPSPPLVPATASEKVKADSPASAAGSDARPDQRPASAVTPAQAADTGG